MTSDLLRLAGFGSPGFAQHYALQERSDQLEIAMIRANGDGVTS
jgi:hypothetical protein